VSGDAGKVARPGRGSRALVGALTLLAIGILAAGCRSIQSDPQRPGLRVRPGVAFEMVADAPGMLIFDLRRPDEFDGPQGHLQRAHNLPLEELPQRLPEIRWLRERTFLIYCRGPTGQGEEDAGEGSEDCGEEAIRFFLGQRFDDVVLLDGGIEAWLEDGFATVGHGAQGPDMAFPEDPGMRVPEDARSIGDPRHLPEPP